MFHLHRFKHGDLLAAMHCVAFSDFDMHDLTLHRRTDRLAVGGAFDMRRICRNATCGAACEIAVARVRAWRDKRGGIGFDETRGDGIGGEGFVIEKIAQEGDIGRHTFNTKL